MDRNDTFPGTSPYARTSMLADDIADRIALAGHPAEIDDLVREVWGHHFAGALTENEVEALDEAARARREAFQARPKPRRDIGRERALAAKRGAKRAIRATKRAAEWRKDLHRAHGYLRSRAGEEEGRALDAELEQRLAEGPAFARYRGGSDFRDAAVLHLDRNAIAKIKTACNASSASGSSPSTGGSSASGRRSASRSCRTGTPTNCTRRAPGWGRCSRDLDPSAKPARLKSHCFIPRAKRSPCRPPGASRTESIPVKRRYKAAVFDPNHRRTDPQTSTRGSAIAARAAGEPAEGEASRSSGPGAPGRGLDRARYLAIGDLGNGDQEIAVVQEFTDRAVLRRMTGRQVKQPGGDGAIHPQLDVRSRIGQNFWSVDDHALKPCLCIHSGFDGRFSHRLL